MKIISFIVSLLLPLMSCAVNPITLPLWGDQGAPTSNGLTPQDETVENPGWISLVAQPELIVYPAENPNGTTLLMCPGGGYYGLAMLHEGKDLAPILNDAGYNYAIVKYRMPNGHHEVPADDARQAIKLLKQYAEEWGINPDRIGIGGASAGGHLASTVATHQVDKDAIPAFQVLFYPVISMQYSTTHQGSKDNLLGPKPSKELIALYSNELNVTPQTPPAFIALSADDGLVPPRNSIDYFNALNANGVPVSMHIYPVGEHGWGTKPTFPYHDQWISELLAWLSNLY